MIRIMLVDDHKLILEAWKILFDSNEEIVVVKTASSAKDAIDFSLVYKPDVILMDINLGEESGIEICQEISNTLPKTKIIGLSFHDNVQIVKKIIDNGAKGYLTKNVSPDEVIEAIRTVYNGGNYICKDIQSKFIQNDLFGGETQNADLTIRELEVLKLIAEGFSSKEVAEKMYVSTRTIETHRYNILKKTSCQNVAQLIAWAAKHGVV